MILQKPTDRAGPPEIADLFESLGQLAELTQESLQDNQLDAQGSPSCPYCGSPRTSLLAHWPDFGDRNAGKYFSMRDGEVIPRRKSDKAVASAAIVHIGRFEAIVDQGTFDQAQAKLDERIHDRAKRSLRLAD